MNPKKLLLCLRGVLLASSLCLCGFTQARIYFGSDVNCDITIELTYYTAPCPGALPATTDCVHLVPYGTGSSPVPSGYVLRGIDIYCGTMCSGTIEGTVSGCTGGTTTFDCCGVTYTIDGTVANGNGGFRVY